MSFLQLLLGQGRICPSLYWILQLPDRELNRVRWSGRGSYFLTVLWSLVRWLASSGRGSLGPPLAPGTGCGSLGTRAEIGHHDLTASGMSGTSAASCEVAGWILRHVHHLGVHERWSDGDVDVELAEGDEVANGWVRPLAETASVVGDEMQRAESLHQA